jgi:ribosome maturation factor RimP
MNKDALIEKLINLISPIVTEKNLELYHIEYVKESGENFLRIYIDSPEGITLDDCEKISRPVSDLLDIEEPITESYYLEVSSPGIERILYTDSHLTKYIGNEVQVKLLKLLEGKKEYEGRLVNFNSEEIIIFYEDNNFNIPKDKIKTISLKGDM